MSFWLQARLKTVRAQSVRTAHARSTEELSKSLKATSAALRVRLNPLTFPLIMLIGCGHYQVAITVFFKTLITWKL